MKILPNLPKFIRLLGYMKYFRPYGKAIDKARAAGDDAEERRHILAATTECGAKFMKDFGCTLHVEGLENIPEEGPVVLVGNHQGYADIAAYFAAFTKFQFGFVAKEELAKIPFYGSWMPRIRSLFIKRDDPKASLETIRQGVELLHRGFSLVIFPEGTRSKGPVCGPFMKGSLKLATRARVPIVPVSMNGTYKVYEETGVLSPAHIHMIVHEPIPTVDLSRDEERGLNDRIEKIVTDGVGRLVAQDGAAKE